SKDYNPSGVRAMGIPIEAVMATSAGGGFMNPSTSNSANKQMAKASGTLDEMNEAILNGGENDSQSDVGNQEGSNIPLQEKTYEKMLSDKLKTIKIGGTIKGKE